MLFFFSSDPYIAIIGDIKQSKKIENRYLVQEKLNKVLNHINETYETDISAKFMITLGDEFQGLLHEGENVFNIIEEIQREMFPVQIRFGIGVGTITTDINPEMAIGADGPCYYKARAAIEFLKRNNQKNKTYLTDVHIEFDESNDSVKEMLNTIFSLLTIIKNKWTNRQREIIYDLIRNQSGQEKCAKRLGIAQSSVQRGLTNANYYAYQSAVDTVNNILKEIGRSDG